MPRSPKRHGVILSGDSWSSLEIPGLSSSPTSSIESVDKIMPSTPRQSVLLPGYHFSTTDEDVDPAEFHRIAAQLLAGEAPSKRDSGLAGDNVQPVTQRQLHCDLGKDPSGRFCCSCGKSYTTSMRLREHVRLCAGTTNLPCNTCDKIFESQDKLDRHVATKHNDYMEPCPECGDLVSAHQLPKHLAAGAGGCDGMIRIALGSAPEIDASYQESSRKSSSQRYWIYEGDLSWSPQPNQTRQPGHPTEFDDAVDQTMCFMKQLLRRPSSQPACRSCDICGELFDADGDELAMHMGKHTLDFAEKRHRCDDCQIYFANEKDLERHLQSANLNDHCGFTFRHIDGSCSGHHPPTYDKFSLTNDHDSMQRHLWAWECCQLRTHRLAVASLLAERLNQSTTSRMSLQNVRRTYTSLLPHFSAASRNSQHLEFDWDQPEDLELEKRLSSILDEIAPDQPVDGLMRIPEDESLRPDSSVIAPTPKKSLGDLTARRKTILDALKPGGKGHKRAQSGPVAFLKQQASRDAVKHRSMPDHEGMVVQLVA